MEFVQVFIGYETMGVVRHGADRVSDVVDAAADAAEEVMSDWAWGLKLCARLLYGAIALYIIIGICRVAYGSVGGCSVRALVDMMRDHMTRQIRPRRQQQHDRSRQALWASHAHEVTARTRKASDGGQAASALLAGSVQVCGGLSAADWRRLVGARPGRVGLHAFPTLAILQCGGGR